MRVAPALRTRPGRLRHRNPLRLRILPAAALIAASALPQTGSAAPPAGSWQYVWGDDFSGTAVDGSKWNVASPSWGMSGDSPTSSSADRVHVGGGLLTLEATRVKVNGSNTPGDEIFEGGMISTYGKHNFNGGYIEARILLPDTVGSWPAFWGLHDGWPPEMDIMEYPLGAYGNNQYHTAFHYRNPSGGNSAGAGQVTTGGDLRGSYHDFGVLWDEDASVRFFLDGTEVRSFYNATEVAEMVSMYLILNYAVAGWPGVPSTTEWPVGFTDETRIDWVRVWVEASGKTSDWSYGGGSEYVLWDTAGNWSNGVPNLSGVTSHFGTVAPAQQRIDWSGTRRLSVINLDGNTRYRFGWPDDRLLLGAGDSGALNPAINLAGSTTTEHEVYCTVEWSGDLDLTNDSSHPLLLTGALVGGDGIRINGPGVVSFDGSNNIYSGATVIDSGGQGPGIGRARGQNALGIGGLVVIGEQGNNTTGRLELENDSLVSNTISLNGRNTATPGIVNNSGTNTISGTVNSQVGGANYWIQSDAGKLVLSGDADGAGGVALSSIAGGTRTFTLQGAGDGEVRGTIANGNASTLNLAKSGAGTWTLDETNSYTGTTTVTAGTLRVEGSTGTGTTTVASAASLAGGGTVRGNLIAQAGATVRVGDTGFPLASSNPFLALDDFDDYTTGSTTAATGGVWNGEFIGTANSNVVSSDGGLALETKGGAAWRGGETDLTQWDAGLDIGETATVFFRMKAAGSGFYSIMTGLAPSTDSIDITNAWSDFAVMPHVTGTAGGDLAYRFPGSDSVIFPMNTEVWYNVWLVVDNDAETYSVYWSTGTNDGTFGGTATQYWQGHTNTALNALGFMADGNAGTSLLVDDVYVAAGSVTAHPLQSWPVLPNASTLDVAGNFTLAAGSTLEFDVSTGALHDKLVVGGSFNANGILKVTLDPAQPAPAPGDTFDLFDAAGGTISFSNYDLPDLFPGLSWDTSSIASGVLRVVGTPSAYWTWADTIAFPAGLDAPDDDADGGLAANVFEFLQGTDPLDAGDDSFPSGEILTGTELGLGDDKRYLTLTARLRADRAGTTLTAEAADTLSGLSLPGASANATQVTPSIPDGEFEWITWYYNVAIDDGDTGFLRLKAVAE